MLLIFSYFFLGPTKISYNCKIGCWCIQFTIYNLQSTIYIITLCRCSLLLCLFVLISSNKQLPYVFIVHRVILILMQLIRSLPPISQFTAACCDAFLPSFLLFLPKYRFTNFNSAIRYTNLPHFCRTFDCTLVYTNPFYTFVAVQESFHPLYFESDRRSFSACRNMRE